MNEKYFNEIDIEDEFFDSLKYDYPGFENWFRRKYNQKAYVQYDNNGKIMGFLFYVTINLKLFQKSTQQ